MNRHLDMPCCMCGKQVHEVEFISTDEQGNVIVMCPQCYQKAKQFFEGGNNNV